MIETPFDPIEKTMKRSGSKRYHPASRRPPSPFKSTSPSVVYPSGVTRAGPRHRRQRMDARERALMRASVALGLLISTLKKHDLEAPLSLDDPHFKELIAHLRDNLLEAQADESVSSVMVSINKAFTDGVRLNARSVGSLLTALKKVDGLLKEAGEKLPPLQLLQVNVG